LSPFKNCYANKYSSLPLPYEPMSSLFLLKQLFNRVYFPEWLTLTKEG
jgi:hypothetical protein